MDNEAHGVNSNLANDKISYCIIKIKRAASGIVKIELEGCPSFICRSIYIPNHLESLLVQDALISESEIELLNQAQRVYQAEMQAKKYIQRAEHSFAQLRIKLQKKGFETKEILPALDYLASNGLIDDARFAQSWLKNRSIHKREGRIKLQALLLARGVNRKIIEKVLDEYFRTHCETEICMQATKKEIRLGKEDNALRRALFRKGFSLKIINECIKSSIKT